MHEIVLKKQAINEYHTKKENEYGIQGKIEGKLGSNICYTTCLQ